MNIKYKVIYWICSIFRLTREKVPFVWRLRNTIESLARNTFKLDYFVKFKIKGDLIVEVNLNDFGGRSLLINGYYEHGTTRELENILNESNNFIDIGANLGFFSLYAARLIGDEGVVYSFEASPVTMKKFKTNILLNNIANIKLFEKAIGLSCTTINFYQSLESHSGKSSLRELDDEDCESVFQVECVNLDSLLSEIQPITLIKIDIEGAEFQALKGMEGLLNRDKPLIILELTDEFLKAFGDSAKDIIQFLTNLKYNLYRIEYNKSTKLIDVPTDQCNILAKPDSLSDLRQP